MSSASIREGLITLLIMAAIVLLLALAGTYGDDPRPIRPSQHTSSEAPQ